MSERQLSARRGEPASRTSTGVRARVCVRVSVSVCTPLSPEAPLSSDGFQQPLSDSCGGGQSGRQPPRAPPGAGTGAAAGGGPGALPRPGRRRRGGPSGVRGWTGAKRVPAGEVLAPGSTRPPAVVFPRWELPFPLPVQTAHSWVTAAGARCLPPLGWVSFHPTLAPQSALEGPRLPASTKEDVPAPSKGTQAKLGEFSLGGTRS